MAESSGDSKQEQLMALVDKQFANPSTRAKEIWSIIQANPSLIEKTDWDILCFAVEFIGMMSQSWTWLEEDAKKLNRLLYTAHYLDRESDANKRIQRRDIGRDNDSRFEPEGKSISVSNEFTPTRSNFE